jgi:hypothetical protein
VKAMLLAFFDRGIVHYEVAPEGQIISQGFYLAVLRHLRHEDMYEQSDVK